MIECYLLSWAVLSLLSHDLSLGPVGLLELIVLYLDQCVSIEVDVRRLVVGEAGGFDTWESLVLLLQGLLTLFLL